MGHKVNPIIFRMGSIHQWKSRWFSKKDFQKLLQQDIGVRKFIKEKFKDAGIARVEVERFNNAVTVIIHTAKPGVIIGRGGQGVEVLKTEMKKKFLEQKDTLSLNILEVPHQNQSAELVLQSMISELEKRMPYRRVMKQALGRIEKAGAKGAKVMVGGRLNGAEIARSEKLSWGSLPLHTLRADIDYSRGAALTTYGKVGVKVWVYKGEKFEKETEEQKNKSTKEQKNKGT
jgi:small subunit ribosomal protein S3